MNNSRVAQDGQLILMTKCKSEMCSEYYQLEKKVMGHPFEKVGTLNNWEEEVVCDA